MVMRDDVLNYVGSCAACGMEGLFDVEYVEGAVSIMGGREVVMRAGGCDKSLIITCGRCGFKILRDSLNA